VNAADERRLAGLIDKRLIATLGIRPPNSPGWGMLRTLRTVKLRDPDGNVEEFKAGTTYVCRDHWAVRARPELFRVADRRDVRSMREHSRALDHAQRELEGGRTRASGPARPRSGVLPSRPTGPQAWRLPGGPSGARPLRLPR
jgi:hypothetical protein